jgi:tetratricopeptide (TPR) repeat protein
VPPAITIRIFSHSNPDPFPFIPGIRNNRIMSLSSMMCALLFAAATASQQADPPELVRQARKLNAEGQQDRAIALYREAIQRAPDLYDAHYGLGIALDLAGREREARDQFARAIELAPQESKNQALTAMAVSYAFSGDAKNSSAFFRQVYDRQTADENYQGAAETANALGRVHLESGDVDNAFKWYQTGYETARRQRDLDAAAIDLWDMRWAHAQARIAARRGNAAEARRQLETVERILDKGTNPDEQIQYPYLAGYVALYLKQLKEAVANLQQANQQDPFILSLLAQAYEKLHNASAAQETWVKVMASNAHSINNAFARGTARKRLKPKV